MIDHRSFARDRLRERSAELLAHLDRGGSARVIASLSGEVKALTDLLIDFGETDVADGHLLLEAQRNRQDVLDAQEEEQKARGLDPEDLLSIINGNRIQ
jgi:hypothetical protein